MASKKTTNQDFLDEVTVNPTYPRPFFTLPDLSGEDGNTFVLASKIHDTLRNHGFHAEATWLAGGGNYNFLMAQGPSQSALMFQTKAEEHANLISLFLTLESNNQDILGEDDEYVYIKQRKNKVVENLPLFAKIYSDASLSDEKLESLYEANEKAFTQFNTYHRHIFYYANTPQKLSWLLEKNEFEQFVPDLFGVDQFHQTPLHACTSMETFTLLAQTMFKQDTEKSHQKLFQHDVFGNSCFITMSRIFEKELKKVATQNLHTFVEFLAIIVSIAPDTAEQLINATQLKGFLEQTPYYDKAILQNKSAYVVETVRSQIEQAMMQLSFPQAQTKNTSTPRL